MKKTLALILAALLALGAVALADTIDVIYNDIKVYINGALTEFTDAWGEEVEPFIYNGNVYLPLPAVADAMGVGYSWDGSTMSAYLGAQVGEQQYLLDVCPPYQDNYIDYYTTANGESVTLAGQKYTNGIRLRNRSYDSFALFNLNGKYKTLSFTLGHIDGAEMYTSTYQIYLDGRLAGEYTVDPENLPQQYELDLNYALTMKIVETDCRNDEYAFVDMTIK